MSASIWNRLAAEFEDSVCDITASSGAQLARLLDKLRITRRHTLVDAGCGIGTFVERFGDRFGSVTAFDFAASMVRRARRRCKQFDHTKWRTLPLEDAARKLGPIGDLVVCLNVVTSPDEKLRLRQWESLAGLMKSKSYLLVVVPSLESARAISRQEGEAFFGTASEQSDLICRLDTPQKHYSRPELRKIFNSLGMSVLSLQRIQYPASDDGVECTTAVSPWDWACLAGSTKNK